MTADHLKTEKPSETAEYKELEQKILAAISSLDISQEISNGENWLIEPRFSKNDDGSIIGIVLRGNLISKPESLLNIRVFDADFKKLQAEIGEEELIAFLKIAAHKLVDVRMDKMAKAIAIRLSQEIGMATYRLGGLCHLPADIMPSAEEMIAAVLERAAKLPLADTETPET